MFIMVLGGSALLSETTNIDRQFKQSYVSVVNSVDEWIEEVKEEEEFDQNGLIISDFLEFKEANEIDFYQSGEQSYAIPGSEGAELGEFFITGDQEQDIELEIEITDAKMINDFVLMHDDEYLKAKINKNTLIFEDVEPGKIFVLKANISKELQSGERIKITLKNAEDRYVSIVQR